MFQFPPSHGGRHNLGILNLNLPKVSIPALAWRATNGPLASHNEDKRFNSRPRMEGDLIEMVVQDCKENVSIPALAWRATICCP